MLRAHFSPCSLANHTLIEYTASFGKDYGSTTTGKSGLVSFLGLSIGLSQTPTISLQ